MNRFLRGSKRHHEADGIKKKTLPQVLKRMLSSVIFIVCGVYIGLMIVAYFMQESIIFHPSRTIHSTPRLEFEDLTLLTKDGLKINAWFLPADNATFTILYCHGNAGNMAGRIEMAEYYVRQKLNVMLFDYRSYGKSEGTRSEQGLYNDVEAAWDYLTKTRGIPPGKIIVMGRSLGGSIAAYIASRHQPAGLILNSAFTSVPGMGSKMFPFFPVSLLAKYRLPTIDYLKEIKVPKLLIHGKLDEVVPFGMGEENYAAAAEPKTFLPMNTGHNESYESNPEYQQAVKTFVDSLRNKEGTSGVDAAE